MSIHPCNNENNNYTTINNLNHDAFFSHTPTITHFMFTSKILRFTIRNFDTYVNLSFHSTLGTLDNVTTPSIVFFSVFHVKLRSTFFGLNDIFTPFTQHSQCPEEKLIIFQIQQHKHILFKLRVFSQKFLNEFYTNRTRLTGKKDGSSLTTMMILSFLLLSKPSDRLKARL